MTPFLDRFPARAGVAESAALRRLKPWDQQKLAVFLEKITVVERAALRLLAVYGKLDKRQFSELMSEEVGLPDFDSRNLAACLASLSRKQRLLGFEPLVESFPRFHRLDAKWAPLLRKCLAKGIAE